MRSNQLISAAVGLVALAAPTNAYWRMQCPGRLLSARMDPIVSAGKISGHVHTISGGSAFNFEMTYAETQTAACSSCPIKQDMSNYWVPALYYQYPNGSFEYVPQVIDGPGVQGGQVVYYLQRGGPNNDNLTAFPEGFRMLAGNPTLRTGSNSFEQQAISFVCMNYSGSSQYYNQLPNVACPDGVRAQVFFPSCWDGVNLDTADHKSHMAYPESVAYNNGPCPSTHPVHMISLFYEIIFQTNQFDWWVPSQGWQPFVFASGDPTGYGFHGDFLNGWDVEVLQEATNTCTNDTNGGDIFACPPFEFFDGPTNQACMLPTSINEDVYGVLDALPGCNPVQYANATMMSGCGDSAKVSIGSPQVFYSNISSDWTYIGCGPDNGANRTFNADSSWTSTMTIEYCMDYCGSQGYKYAGLEYSTQCFCGATLPANLAPVPGILGNCLSPCAGNSSQYCGGASRLSIYELTGNFSLLTGPESVADMSCPMLQGQNITLGGNTYQFACGMDFRAGDIGSTGIATPGNLTQCAQACNNHASCTYAVLSGGACYMKSGLRTPLTNSGTNALFLISVNGTAYNATTATSTSTNSVSNGAAAAVAQVPGATYTAAPTCPGSNSTYYQSANKGLYLIECGIDHVGGDLSAKVTPSLQACIETCANTTGCVDVSLASGTCYMKSNVGRANPVGYVLGAKFIAFSNTTTATGNSTSTVASNSTSATTAASSTSAAQSTTTVVSPNAAIGATASTSPSSTAAPARTSSAAPSSSATSSAITSSTTSSAVPSSTTASSTTSSTASTTTTTPPVTTPASTTATTSTGPAPTYTTAPSCPSSNSTYYKSSNGDLFIIECGIDHYGGDLTSKSTGTYQACIEACSTTSGCVDVSYVSGSCYMKSVVNAANAVSYVWGARLVQSPASNSSTTAASPNQANAGSTATSTTASASNSSTTAASPNQANAGSTATSTTASASSTATAAVCPQNNGTVYVDPVSGYQYLIECGIDHVAGNLAMTYVSSLSGCISACSTTSGCVDVSLSGAACYMKNSTGAAQQNSGVQGARLINTSSTQAPQSTATLSAQGGTTFTAGPPVARTRSATGATS